MMYPLLSLQFFFFFILFFVAIYSSFYLPGALLLTKYRFSLGLHILLSFVIGLVLWGFQGYIFGYLGFRFLSYLYVVGILIASVKLGILSRKVFYDGFQWVKGHILLSAFVFCGVIAQLLPVFSSGVLYPDGVRFFGVNAADGIMHLAYIQSIADRFPPMEPGAAGHLLTNYHYWSDMIIADLSRVWYLPITHSLFQYFPLFISLLTALSAFQVIKRLGFSEIAGWWAIFFLFFAGDAAYALMLITTKTLSFSAPAIDNGVAQFLNMPNAMARPIFLTSLITFSFFRNERKKIWVVLTLLLFASLVGIKIYYGMFVIFGAALVLTFAVLKRIIHNKSRNFGKSVVEAVLHEKQFILMFGALCLIAAGIFLPSNKGAGGFGWYPLEWPKIFLGPSGLNWGDWYLRKQVYEQYHNIRNIILYDGLAIIFTLICIHGTRLIGLFPSSRVYRKIGSEFLIFFFPGLIIFHFLGLYTLQKAGGFNVFNFFVVSTVVLSLLSAMVLEKVTLSHKYPLTTLLAVLIILLSIMRPISEVQNAIRQLQNPKTESSLISNDELKALNYIRDNSVIDDVVQSHPTDYLDSNTPYVSFFTGRLTYLTGVGLQKTHNQPIADREIKLKELFSSTDSPSMQGHAQSLGIRYIYLKKNTTQQLKFELDPNLVKKIYENPTIVVYRIIY